MSHVITNDGAKRCPPSSTPLRRRRGTVNAATLAEPGCIVCGLSESLCAQHPVCSGRAKFSIAPHDQKSAHRREKRRRRG